MLQLHIGAQAPVPDTGALHLKCECWLPALPVHSCCRQGISAASRQLPCMLCSTSAS